MKHLKYKIFLSIVIITIFGVVLFIFLGKDTKKENVSTKYSEKNKENILAGEQKDNNEKREVFALNVLMLDDCVNLTGDEKKKCLIQANYNTAYIDDDIKYCLDIDDYNKRDACIYGWVKKLNSSKNCERIPSHAHRNSCIQDISISTRYIDFCNTFNNEPNEKKECLDRVKAFTIPEKFDINKCAEIGSLEYKNLCFQHFYGHCDEIKERDDRNNCISAEKYYLISKGEDCKSLKSDKYRRVCLQKFKDENKNKKSTDIDTDNDGLWDEKELWVNTDPFNPDTDGDGLTDYQEVMEIHSNPIVADTDQDGLSDSEEVKLGTDVQKPDTDGDGVWDGADKDPLNGDTDRDGLDDVTEALWGTDINKKDTDGDGVSDYDEVRDGKNPLGEGWKQDTDGDGLIDVDEIFYLTNPLMADTDGDGVNDKDEIEAGTNPNGPGDFDFDGDRLSNKEELKLGTNPYKSDTNGDGVTDYESIKEGLDPISKDTDNDGLSNIYELKNKLNPIKSDTDGDGLSDGDEINKYFTNPKDQDTDNDGFLDGEEVQAGFDPKSASGV